MKNEKTNKALDEFLGDEEQNVQPQKGKKKLITAKEGLIERVDKILVTEDGRQLLREQY